MHDEIEILKLVSSCTEETKDAHVNEKVLKKTVLFIPNSLINFYKLTSRTTCTCILTN